MNAIDESPTEILWLHIPKTSSTFSITVQVLCQEKKFWEKILPPRTTSSTTGYNQTNLNKFTRIYRGCVYLKQFTDWNPNIRGVNTDSINECNWTCKNLFWHRPIPSNWDPATFVTILRNPKSRLISSFLDGHFHELSKESKTQLNMTMNGKVINRLVHEAGNRLLNDHDYALELFNIYSKLPENIGCQVKMIAGEHCQHNVIPTEETFNQAKQRLHQLKYVGIYERYQESIEYFHKLILPNSKRGLHPLELHRFRDSSIFPNRVKLRKTLEALDYHDPLDDRIYEEAIIRFNHHINSLKKL